MFEPALTLAQEKIDLQEDFKKADKLIVVLRGDLEDYDSANTVNPVMGIPC